MTLALLGAMLDVRLPASGPSAPPVAVVDVSSSIGPGPLAPPPQARIAPRWVAVAETVREVEGRAAAPGLAREGSSISSGLRAASALWPGRDLWLFTDGRATDGDPALAARAAAAAGARVHVSAPVRPAADVGWREAHAVRGRGGAVIVHAVLTASTAGGVTVRLRREGRVVAEEAVRLEPQVDRVLALEDRQAPLEGASWDLELDPESGTPNDDAANDVLRLGVPPAQPSILIWGDLSLGPSVGASGVRVRHAAVIEPGAFAAADCVVLSSVPWSRIGAARTRALRGFVAGGGRLLLLGGPEAWAGGGWAGTALERDLSPLRVERDDGEGLALLLAVDRSGSTADGALDRLRRAASEAAATLKPGEHLAVLPFASVPAAALLDPGWMTAEDGPDARDRLGRSLTRLTSGGGTDLPAVIRAAAERLGARPASQRRLMLLTDGDPDHRPDPEALRAAREALDQADVEFAAVVSGMPEAARLLAEHVADDPADVILLEDATALPERLLRALAQARGERERLGPPEALEWIEAPGGTPPALAPTSMQALERHPEGEVIARAVYAQAPTGRPFAGRRRIGAGEVVALAWGPVGEADPLEAGGRVALLVLHLAAEADRGLLAAFDDGDLVVRLPAAATAGAVEVLQGEDVVGLLLESAPGLFRGRLQDALLVPGLQVRLPAVGTQGERQRPLRLPVRPPPEHRGAGVDEGALRKIAAAGGGLRLPAGEAPPSAPREDGVPLRPWLLLLGAILLVFDRMWTEGAASTVRASGSGEGDSA